MHNSCNTKVLGPDEAPKVQLPTAVATPLETDARPIGPDETPKRSRQLWSTNSRFGTRQRASASPATRRLDILGLGDPNDRTLPKSVRHRHHAHDKVPTRHKTLSDRPLDRLLCHGPRLTGGDNSPVNVLIVAARLAGDLRRRGGQHNRSMRCCARVCSRAWRSSAARRSATAATRLSRAIALIALLRRAASNRVATDTTGVSTLPAAFSLSFRSLSFSCTSLSFCASHSLLVLSTEPGRRVRARAREGEDCVCMGVCA